MTLFWCSHILSDRKTQRHKDRKANVLRMKKSLGDNKKQKEREGEKEKDKKREREGEGEKDREK
jgi:hypothetical protein